MVTMAKITARTGQADRPACRPGRPRLRFRGGFPIQPWQSHGKADDGDDHTGETGQRANGEEELLLRDEVEETEDQGDFEQPSARSKRRPRASACFVSSSFSLASF